MGVWDSETCKGAKKQLNEGPEDSAEELRGLEDEVIPQTDKGNATIVMRRCNYDRKKKMMGTGTYGKLREDHTANQ